MIKIKLKKNAKKVDSFLLNYLKSQNKITSRTPEQVEEFLKTMDNNFMEGIPIELKIKFHFSETFFTSSGGSPWLQYWNGCHFFKLSWSKTESVFLLIEYKDGTQKQYPSGDVVKVYD